MAKFIVPPKKPKGLVLLKCYSCGTLYSPDKKVKNLISNSYEPCPECGYAHNSDGQQIPLWKYNLIKWWREKSEDDAPEQQEEDVANPPVCGSAMTDD